MKLDRNTIKKVLDDKATPEEARQVAEWFGSDEGSEFLSRYISEEMKNLTEEEALSWLDHTVPEQRMENRFLSGIKQSKRKHLNRKWWIAAALIPFLFLGTFTTFLAERAGVFSETEYQEVYVPYGEQMQVMLQDGTKVTLNSGTQLRYPQKFGLFNRTVWLTGEGYFEVAKMKTAPFKVELGGVNVEVTGTKFDVKSYADDQKIWVALEEGGVKLNDDKRLTFTLVPGDRVEYDRLSGKCRVERMEDIKESASWRDNSLNFYLIPLADILKVLQRQYDVRFAVRDSSLLDSRFTLSTAKVNVDDVLKDLETVSHIDFKQRSVSITNETLLQWLMKHCCNG